MTPDITIYFQAAAQKIKSQPKNQTIRLISHYDADGISAAAIMAHALRREGYDFHATLMRNPFTKGLDRLKTEDNNLIIFTDMGSGQLKKIEELNTPSIILDHHQYHHDSSEPDIIQINANSYNINGNYEACGATLAYGLAKALNPKNHDLSIYGLTGAIGDKQHIGGLRGYNQTVLADAKKHNHITTKTTLKLSGPTIKETLTNSIEPYYQKLSGNKKAVEKLLKKLHIDPQSPPQELKADQHKKLQSLLYLQLIKAGVKDNILETVIRERYTSPTLKTEIERFADLLDSAGKTNHRGLALALALDPKNNWQEALTVEKDYKTPILEGLQSLESGGLLEKNTYSYFYNDHSSLGGVIAGIAANYILVGKRPLISLVRKEEDNEIHISSRGSQELVKSGLDLGAAMKDAAAQINGHGGGHMIAAGATIPLDKEEDFLNSVDTIIEKQLQGATNT